MHEPWPPSVGPHHIRTEQDGQALAAALCDPARPQPIVAISMHPDAAEPLLDAEDIADELRGLVPVLVLTAQAAHGLTDALGSPRPSVFHGAGRLYPPGDGWLHDPAVAPLFLCSNAVQAHRVARELIAAALAAADISGLLTAPDVPGTERITARVGGFSSDHQVLVRTEHGEPAVLHTARLRADVPGERLLRRGQQLRGTLRTTGPLVEFLPAPPAGDVAELVRRECPDGACVPALVADVADGWAQVLLHPDYPVVLLEPADELVALIRPGDVIAVEVAWIDGSAVVTLGEESRALDALPILPGGPPWIELAAPDPLDLQPTREPRPAPMEPLADPVAQQRMTHARAAEDLQAQRAGQLLDELDVERRANDSLRAELRLALVAGRSRDLPEVYADAEEQFRWEIATTYLTEVDEPDRPAAPMVGFTLGRSFLGRLETLSGIPRHKVLQLVVEVLCGRAPDLPSRQVRPWLDSSGVHQVRPDGAEAWRAALQVQNPSARALKFWRLPDGRVELDAAGLPGESG